VYVRVRLQHDDMLKSVSAQAFIRRLPGGHLIALIDLGWRRDWSEWLAHEFEHVLELADAESVRTYIHTRGTWESGLNAYESTRAIDVGREVRAEVTFRSTAR